MQEAGSKVTWFVFGASNCEARVGGRLLPYTLLYLLNLNGWVYLLFKTHLKIILFTEVCQKVDGAKALCQPF